MGDDAALGVTDIAYLIQRPRRSCWSGWEMREDLTVARARVGALRGSIRREAQEREKARRHGDGESRVCAWGSICTQRYSTEVLFCLPD